MTRTEKAKASMLLAWYSSVVNDKKHSGHILEEEFGLRYWWLFRRYPKFYTWGPFYRDHGSVGLRGMTKLS